MANSFQVILPSNVKGNPDNKPGQYETTLASTLETPGQWEVAIMNCSYTHSWINIQQEFHVGILTWYTADDSEEDRTPILGTAKTLGLVSATRTMFYERDPLASRLKKRGHPYVMKNLFTIVPGQYNDIKTVIGKLQTEIRAVGSGLGNVKVELVDDGKRIKISEALRDFYIVCYQDYSLLKLLGFGKQTENNNAMKYYDDKNQEVVRAKIDYIKIKLEEIADLPVKLVKPIRHIYVYTDIIDYVHIGDTKAPLLGQFLVSTKWGESNQHNFTPPYYIRVNQDHIRNICIKLCDETGEVIDFRDGTVTVSLHFQRMQNPFNI